MFSVFEASDRIGRKCGFGNISSLSVHDLFCGGLSYLPQRCGNLSPFTAIHNLKPLTSYRFIVLSLNAVTVQYYSEFYNYFNDEMKSSANKTVSSSNFDILNKQVNYTAESIGGMS